VLQTHHVFYEPEEIITRIYRGEHYLVTMLNRRTKNISAGFIHSLLYWIEKYINQTVDLNDYKEETRKIYKNNLYDYIRKYKEINMQKGLTGKVRILDCWQNAYSLFYTFKVSFENKIYLIHIPIDKLHTEDINNILSYIDMFFPNLDDTFKVEEIMDFNCGKDDE